MSNRTYTRTYLAVVTQEYTVSEGDLTADQLAALDRLPDPAHLLAVDDVLVTVADADWEDVSTADDWQLSIERTA